MAKRITVYELYGSGGFLTHMSTGYNGFVTAVAAVSLKQAHYFARNGDWVDDIKRPLGILWQYSKGREGGDHLTPDGKWAYQPTAPSHGRGVTSIRPFIKDMVQVA